MYTVLGCQSDPTNRSWVKSLRFFDKAVDLPHSTKTGLCPPFVAQCLFDFVSKRFPVFWEKS
jgi:hypothetical protein